MEKESYAQQLCSILLLMNFLCKIESVSSLLGLSLLIFHGREWDNSAAEEELDSFVVLSYSLFRGSFCQLFGDTRRKTRRKEGKRKEDNFH